MNSQTVTTLLNFFPLGGVFSTLTLKMQAPPRRKPRDTLLGVFPELWYGDPQQPKPRWMPLGPGQWYLLLFQGLEGSLPFFCADHLYRLIRGEPKKKEIEDLSLSKRKKQKALASAPSAGEEVLQYPFISGPNLTYLVLRTVHAYQPFPRFFVHKISLFPKGGLWRIFPCVPPIFNSTNILPHLRRPASR